MTLSLDAGGFAGNITDDTDPDHISTYEIIDGKRAKIVIPKISGQGMTGVYFGFQNNLPSENQDPMIISSADTQNFTVVGNNLTPAQQKIALKIFRTIKVNKDFKLF